MGRVGLAAELSDGVVILRPPTSDDLEALDAGRDSEFHRFMREGSPNPDPTAVVLNNVRQMVGWIDYDTGRPWLTTKEANLGYCTFPEHRRRGYAGRALLLLLAFLADNTTLKKATLLIDPANVASIAVARRSGFERAGEVESQVLYKRYLS